MTKLLQAMLVCTTASMVLGQRGSFAGSKPIGFPALATPAPTGGDELGNRFGGDNNAPSTASTTTQRLPIEANGDRELINRLSKLPVDNQPFWFVNWQALEAHRNNPQTYPQRPNPFSPNQPTNADGAHIEAENSGNVNRNAGSTGSADANPSSKNSDSNTRNVDVIGVGQSSARDNSNNADRTTTPNAVQNDVNPEDALANRYDNDKPIENAKPTSIPAKKPPKNSVFSSEGNPRTSSPEKPVNSFGFQGENARARTDQSRGIPKFDLQTRWYPALSSVDFGPSHRYYDFMERRPISTQSRFRRFDSPFYYL